MSNKEFLKKMRASKEYKWLENSRRNWIRCTELQSDTVKKLIKRIKELEDK